MIVGLDYLKEVKPKIISSYVAEKGELSSDPEGRPLVLILERPDSEYVDHCYVTEKELVELIRGVAGYNKEEKQR